MFSTFHGVQTLDLPTVFLDVHWLVYHDRAAELERKKQEVGEVRQEIEVGATSILLPCIRFLLQVAYSCLFLYRLGACAGDSIGQRWYDC